MKPSSDRAAARRAARLATEPRLVYPAELPVSARHDEIRDMIRDNQVVVVAGETGSGKTTQLPKICLELGRGVEGMIGHTQPRRIAARTVAERLSEEMAVELGGAVGYAVRFTDRVGESTRVKVMTDGLLLAEIRRDRKLRAYDTIIVDEAHERSLNIDFLLGYLASLLPQRPDLKLVITSATIDTGRFARHFGAPVVEVSGRTWPVEIRYRPPGAEDGPDGRAGEQGDINSAICDAVGELMEAGPGDVLVFLPGERDIRDAAAALKDWSAGRSGREVPELLPLYSRLSAAEQHRVFKPHRGRRVVLATNVAETSLTVPGIRFVVDTGLARVSRYSHRTKVQRLPIEAVSRASADQRAGRCGRVAPGVCIRLYAEDDYLERPEFTDPEILRTNLASVILQMAALGLGEIEDFPFLEPPDRRSIADGRALLEELGALESQPDGARITRIGRRLAELPLDPRLARMVVEAERRGCLREVTVITAALSIQDPRERPSDPVAGPEATGLHRRFDGDDSDFLSLVRLWDHLAALQSELSGNAFRRRCRSEYLHVLRVREWQDLVGQIRQVHRSSGIHPNTEPASADEVHLALLSGLLSHVGRRDRERADYQGTRNSRWTIGRESSLSRRQPAWAMAGALVETDRTRARTVARIDPRWLEAAGAHLLKYSWSEPWWDPERGEAVCDENASLLGLPVVIGRRASYARVDPEEARRIFIERALVGGDWDQTVPPLRRRARLEEQVRALEERVRRANLLCDPAVLADFYDGILPPEITGRGRFLRWWRNISRSRPDVLDVPLEVLVDRRGGPVDLSGYPDRWVKDGLSLDLVYRYEPGSPDDGVTVRIPLLALSRLQSSGFDWHVPGFRRELVAALIRLAPKTVRREIGPAPDAADEFLRHHSPSDGPLRRVLADWLSERSGTPVVPAVWSGSTLPDHLTVGFAVVEDGRTLARGRDLAALRSALDGRLRSAVAAALPGVERHGATAWVFGDIPRVVERDDLRAHPALVDEGSSVGVSVFLEPGPATAAAWAGTRRLLLLSHPLPLRHLTRRLSNETRLALARSQATPGAEEQLLSDCADAVLEQVIVAHGGPAYEERAFAAMSAEVSSGLAERVARVATIAGGVVAAADMVRAAADRLEKASPSPAVRRATDAVREQLASLTRPGFVSAAGIPRLRDLLRYIDAAGRRIQALPGDARRDAERQAVIDRVQTAFDGALDRHLADRPGAAPPAVLAEVRWMIEDLRVSLWAQSLGTARPVSEARIQKAIASLPG